MIETGRICMKLMGREAGKYCAILKKVDDNYVLVDGDVRRRKCNLKHLELIDVVINIKSTATKKEIIKLLQGIGFVGETKKKKKAKREKRPKPVKKRVLKVKEKEEKEPKKKKRRKSRRKKKLKKKAKK